MSEFRERLRASTESQPTWVTTTAPRPYYRVTRTAAEWFAALAALFLLAPLMMAIGLAVKLNSPGPAFYSQIRLGKCGRPFRIYKFRTMTHNCESSSGAIWARVDDPRITPLGRMLRDTHLDELPQLWNVIRGEMSLIGPRPERPELAGEIERVVPGFSQRLVLRPGLTGLAQIRLPADREMHRVAHKLAQDLYYIQNIGPAMDLKILISTTFIMIESACNSVARLAIGEDPVEMSSAIKNAIHSQAAAAAGTAVPATSTCPESEPMLLAA